MLTPRSSPPRARKRLLLAAAPLVLGLAGGCGESSAPTELDAGGAASAARGDLVDEAPARGLDYTNVSGDALKSDILAACGAGVALLDLDADGDLDVVFGQGLASLEQAVDGPGADLAVYRNTGAGYFERAAGPGLVGWWTGLATGDLDGDGDTDLVAGGYGGLEVLLQNEAGELESWQSLTGDAPTDSIEPGQPRDVGRIPRWTSAVALFDADGDGRLDLYAGGYLELDPRAPRRDELGVDGRTVPCRWKGHEVHCGPRGLVPQPDRLFRGRGDGSFAEVTADGLAGLPVGPTVAVVPGDFDGDGDVDLFVANHGSRDLLLVNDGRGVFEERGQAAGWTASAGGHLGIARGDVDRDGRLDWVLASAGGEPTALWLAGAAGLEDATSRYGLADETRALYSWSAQLADLDGDGWLELFTANGHVYPQADEDRTGTRYGQPDTLWSLGPEPRARALTATRVDSILATPGATRGAALGDVDGDGREDLVLLRLDGPCALGINRLGERAQRLVVHLAGPAELGPEPPRTPRDASGARVVLVVGEGSRQFQLVRELQTSRGYLSASSPALHFGLGQEPGYARLRVEWPSGATCELPAGTAGRALWIEEGRGLVREEPLRAADPGPRAARRELPR